MGDRDCWIAGCDLPKLSAGGRVGPDVARAGRGHAAAAATDVSRCGSGVAVAALALPALRILPLLLGLDRQH